MKKQNEKRKKKPQIISADVGSFTRFVGNTLAMVKKEPRAPSVSGIQGTSAPVIARALHATSDTPKPAQTAPAKTATAATATEPLSTLDG